MSFIQIPTKLEPRLRRMEAEAQQEALGAWTGYTEGRDQVLLVLFQDQCRIVMAPAGEQVWSRAQAHIATAPNGLNCLVTIEPPKGRRIRFLVDRPEAHAEIQAALTGKPVPERHGTELSRMRVVTLQELPGHRITQVHGVVSGVGSLSGWTAAEKGRGAVDRAFPDLVASAQQLGANAIIGLQGSPFAAAGGITNMLGGDAVGVLLIGTAVTAEPLAK